MGLNGKPIGFLESVELFGDTMGEQHMNVGKPNGMIIIASDGDKTIRFVDGDDNTILDSLSTVLYSDKTLFNLLESALALAITARLKSDNDDTD